MMETDKLIEALRTESRYKEKATLEIMDLCMMAADKLEELNDFERSQCTKLLVKLAEKDKQITDLETQHRVEFCESAGYDCEVRGQLAAAVDFIHYIGPDAMEAYRAFNVPQETGEDFSAPPAWAAQFERRFMGGEGGG